MSGTKTKNHTDIKSDGWIEQFLIAEARPYAYLLRLDRPIGTWLLLVPGWWAIMLAAGGGPGINSFIFYTMALFWFGAIVMRGAGCIINDLWDRKLDRQVERTKTRPLAAGTISEKQAFVCLAALLLTGLLILWQMSLVTVLLGFMVFPMIILYPLMKRWTWWPQAFLGLTFNFGALMGWAAVNDVISLTAVLLYAAGFFWTLGYDTIYAHQDKEDDMRVGIKSTALKFGDNSKNYVTIFYVMAMLLLVLAFYTAGAGWLSVALLTLPAGHFAWQLKNWDSNDPENSLRIFKSNQDFGMLVLLAAIL